MAIRKEDFEAFEAQADNSDLTKCCAKFSTRLDGFARDEGDCDGTCKLALFCWALVIVFVLHKTNTTMSKRIYTQAYIYIYI